MSRLTIPDEDVLRSDALEDPGTLTAADIDTLLQELARLDRHEAEHKARKEAAVAELDEAIGPTQKRAEAIRLTVASWADQHKEALTQGGARKTFSMANGRLTWTKGRGEIVHEVDEARSIEELEAAGLDRFLRRPPVALDKNAVRKEPVEVEPYGITVGPGEDEFKIKPVLVSKPDPLPEGVR